MLLDKYDFYDIYSLLTGIRSKPDEAYNSEMLRAVYDILSATCETSFVDLNVIRTALRKTADIDKELYHWVYVDNVYTYGRKLIRDELCYSVLLRAFLKMVECAELGDVQRLKDLADALHNLPLFFADGCKNLKRAVKIQFYYYNKKYKTDLWKELSN